MNKDIEQFIQELNELTNKYKIVIGGCGCCGSPYLDNEKDKENGADYLRFDYDTRKYRVDCNKTE